MSPNWFAVWASLGGLVALVAGGWLIVRLHGSAAGGVVGGVLVVGLAPFVAVLVLAGLVVSALTAAVEWMARRQRRQR